MEHYQNKIITIIFYCFLFSEPFDGLTLITTGGGGQGGGINRKTILIDNIFVKVLHCQSSWFGVTYKEDKYHVKEMLKNLINQNKYPSNLFPIY